MNSVVLIGRLTRDPEVRYTPSTQMAVCTFTLAVDRQARQGQEREADFIRITVFGKQAETCEKYLSKGRQVGVHGRIQTGSYKNKDGATVYTTDVIADRVEFLGGGNSGSGDGSQRQQYQSSQNQNQFGSQQNQSNFDDFDDEMPDSFQSIDEDVPF